MSRFFADFHIHSRYSAATSPELTLPNIAQTADAKGVGLITTGDFTHPLYFSEIQNLLEPAGEGIFRMRDGKSKVRFILTVEVNHIFERHGKIKKVHQILFAPSLEIAGELNRRLASWGDLADDGRPVLKREAKDLVKLALDLHSDCVIVPAHIWTPWFSLLGSEFGFESLEECYGEEAKNIFALETGLDSDPAMNRRMPELDRITCLSNSDAHSLDRIGREASEFDCAMNYFEIVDAIRTADSKRFVSTIEYFPSQGKYYYDGHRKCKVSLSPRETREHDYICPQCSRRLTLGVLHQVERLGGRSAEAAPQNKIPFQHVVALREIVADALNKSVDSDAVHAQYSKLIHRRGGELEILLATPEDLLYKEAGAAIAERILKMRRGEVEIVPGYDGVYGEIKILQPKVLQKELF